MLTMMNEVHCTKFPSIVVDQAMSISEKKLNMVMLTFFVLLIIPKVFALHSQVRDDCIITESKDQMFPISINIIEFLSCKLLRKDRCIYFFNHFGIKYLDHLQLPYLWFKTNILEKSPHSLDLRQLRHNKISTEKMLQSTKMGVHELDLSQSLIIRKKKNFWQFLIWIVIYLPAVLQKQFDNIINFILMAIMVIGFLSVYCIINIIVLEKIELYKYEIIVWWNISNGAYLLLNAILLFIINFQIGKCGRYALLKCCYVQISEASIKNQGQKQNKDHSHQCTMKTFKLMKEYILGCFYPFLTPLLIVLLILSWFSSCVRSCISIRKNKTAETNPKINRYSNVRDLRIDDVSDIIIEIPPSKVSFVTN